MNHYGSNVFYNSTLLSFTVIMKQIEISREAAKMLHSRMLRNRSI